MQRLQGKHILLGITGGIAAYKSADLCSRLKQAGALVRVMMTSAATEFVSAITFQALSGNPVHRELFDETVTTGMSHIELARWADTIIIVPASANTLAKLAQGRADNLLTTVCLASEAIKCFVPAMNRVMWEDLNTRHNCQTLLDQGWYQFGPDSGSQACGEVGEGRMQAVDAILKNLSQCFNHGLLQGLHVFVTAGPTYEPIDPVRYIANRSSGRMGYAIAEAAQEAGALVTLLSGPTHLPKPATDVFIGIETAAEMYQVVMEKIGHCDIYISAAAIADYRVEKIALQKIKKQTDQLSLSLSRNPDILSAVAALPKRPCLVGFAAETENLQQYAIEKLKRKNLDMIVANDVSENASTGGEKSTGFNSDYNALQVYWQNNGVMSQQHFATERKTRLAKKLIEHISRLYREIQTYRKAEHNTD